MTRTHKGKLYFVRDESGNYLESERVWRFTPEWVRNSTEAREALADGRIWIIPDYRIDEDDPRNHYRDPTFRKEFNAGDTGDEG